MEIKYSFTDYNDVLQTHLRLLRHAIKFEALEKLGEVRVFVFPVSCSGCGWSAWTWAKVELIHRSGGKLPGGSCTAI